MGETTVNGVGSITSKMPESQYKDMMESGDYPHPSR